MDFAYENFLLGEDRALINDFLPDFLSIMFSIFRYVGKVMVALMILGSLLMA